jgi:hypothetical protein
VAEDRQRREPRGVSHHREPEQSLVPRPAEAQATRSSNSRQRRPRTSSEARDS